MTFWEVQACRRGGRYFFQHEQNLKNKSWLLYKNFSFLGNFFKDISIISQDQIALAGFNIVISKNNFPKEIKESVVMTIVATNGSQQANSKPIGKT